MPDDSWGLAAGGLKDAREMFIQDGLGVFVRGARKESQGVGGELGSTSHDLGIFSFLLLVNTDKAYKVINLEKTTTTAMIHFSSKNQSLTHLLNLL